MNFFGTDGIRGRYGSQITDKRAYQLGRALAMEGVEPVILVARDTRLSGPTLFNALVQGIYSGGGSAINLGILPTNAVSHFVRKFGGDYGVMISASHNAPTDNGLKVFDKYGVKLCKAKQLQLSKTMATIADNKMGYIFEPIFHDIDNMYCEDIATATKASLKGLRIALDCCFGASYKVAKQLFSMLGAKVSVYNNRPRGECINVNCGATNIEFLHNLMKDNRCHLGFAFDGDCDRVAVLEGDRIVDNNAVLLAIARYLQSKDRLNSNTVVGTILTNSGLELALQQHGITLLRSDVGDNNIATLMQQKGLNVGGEQSGHYILSDYATTSDALIVAVLIASIYQEVGGLLQYTGSYQPIHSMSIDIDTNKVGKAYQTGKALSQLASSINNNYTDSRVVIRPSGTESKIRCYIEGYDCQQIADLVVATIANI